MILFPNAKINLGLNVISRRPDGYHDVATVMIPIPSLRDVLEVVPGRSDALTFTATGRPIDCPIEKNLAVKAYRALEAELGQLPPVDIYLDKLIPDGAGLGGGSADAAFALRGIRDTLGLDLDDTQLEAVAARIGADCPFFIANRPALCTGIGTTLTPVEIPALKGYTIAVAKRTDTAVPTASAYAGITPRQPAHDIMSILALPPEEWRGLLVNDFETTVFPAAPAIAALKDHFYDTGAVYASMSGSGAAVYGIFSNDKLAHASLSALSGCVTNISVFDRD